MALGWQAVNGWTRLRNLLQRWPNLQPLTLIVDLTIPGSVSPEIPGVAAGTAFVVPEGEFYCFATSVHGFTPAAPATTVLGLQAAIAAWPAFAPPDGWSATVDVRLDTGGIRFSNSPVRVGHIFGSGDFPYYWPVPWIFPGGSTLRVQVAQRTTGAVASNRAFFCFTGFRRSYTDPPLPVDVLLDPYLLETFRASRAMGPLTRCEPYVYGINFETLPIGLGVQRTPFKQEQGSVSIADGDFALCDLMGSVDDPSATTVLEPPDGAVRLNLKSGALNLDDRPQGFRNVLGTGREPGRLMAPALIERGDSLTALCNINTAVASLSGAPNVFMSFSGVRMFSGGRR